MEFNIPRRVWHELLQNPTHIMTFYITYWIMGITTTSPRVRGINGVIFFQYTHSGGSLQTNFHKHLYHGHLSHMHSFFNNYFKIVTHLYQVPSVQTGRPGLVNLFQYLGAWLNFFCTVNFWYVTLTLNVRVTIYSGLTRPIALHRQVINSHDIGYVN